MYAGEIVDPDIAKQYLENLIFDGTKYDPTKLTKGLISAPSEIAWVHIRDIFLSDYLPTKSKI